VAAAKQDSQEVSVVEGQMEPVRRGWKRGGATVLPNPAAVVAKRGRGPVVLAYLLYPVAPGKKPPAAVKLTFAEVSGGRSPVAVSVTVPGRRRMVIADQLGRGPITVAGQVVRGEMALVTV
jgi:hypothetical protein